MHSGGMEFPASGQGFAPGRSGFAPRGKDFKPANSQIIYSAFSNRMIYATFTVIFHAFKFLTVHFKQMAPSVFTFINSRPLALS